ncbi:MAG: spore coat protein U domain-containing protein [Nitrospiraceae bacterium]|nr:spore coat protein U domain-containing protein [Nitrospiraceae bacterium]
MKKSMAVIVLTVCMVLVAGAAFAASSNSSVTVSGTVQGVCQFDPTSGTALSFGSITPNVAATTTNNVIVECTNGWAYSLAVNTGLNSASCAGSACMKNGTNYMNYAASLASASGTGAGFGSPITDVLTGTVSATDSQNAAVGSYNDTLTVTLTY